MIPIAKFLRRCSQGAFVIAILLVLIPIARAEKVVLVAGGSGGDGTPAVQAKVITPFGLAFDKAGNLYIGEYSGQRIRKIDTKGIITTIAGNGKVGFAGDGGPALSAQFNCIHDLVIGPDDNLYIADSFNRRVRKIDLTTGIITTIAGTADGKAPTGDGGPADKANLDGVASLWFNPEGTTLYLSGFSKVVRTIDLKTNIINTVKGLPGGRSIAIDSKGNLYVAGGKSLSVRSPDGAVRVLIDAKHFAGAEQGLGDNPKHLGIDAQDNVLICDEQHGLLRKYIPDENKLVTIAGNGKAGTAGVGGAPADLQLNRPHGICRNPENGIMYIADSMNDRIVRFEPTTIYESWANFRLDSAITTTTVSETAGKKRTAELNWVLKAVTSDAIILEQHLTVDEAGSKVEEPATMMRYPRNLPDFVVPGIKIIDRHESEATIKVDGRNRACSVVETTDISADLKTKSKVWNCPEIPGFVSRIETTIEGPEETKIIATVTRVLRK